MYVTNILSIIININRYYIKSDVILNKITIEIFFFIIVCLYLGISDEHKTVSKILNDNEQKQVLSLSSTDTDVKDTADVISTHSTIDESFYEVPTNEELSTSIPNVMSNMSDVHTTN
jgi:hypothetical protein